MKTRKRKRVMALLLCLCMILTMLPLTGMASAAEPCPNHAAHDDTCGFVQAVEGHGCGHTHGDKCGYTEAKEGMPCKHEQGEHDESCGYAPPSEEAPCEHTHDESCGEPDENGGYPGCTHEHVDCGYAPASEGTPCAHQEHDGNCGYDEAKEGAPCKHEHDKDCGYVQEAEGKPCNHIHDESCSDESVQDSSITKKNTYASAFSQGSGYTFDPVSRTLTITSADGLTAWPENSEIKRLGGKAAIGSLSISGVTEIGEGVFSYCSNMTSVTLGEGLVTIGAEAFKGCALLENLALPGSLESIGRSAFEDCRKMNTGLPDGLEYIDNSAFKSCSALSLTALPRGLKTLGGGAFNGCTSLAVTALPDNITVIEQGTFMDCGSLVEMELPAGLTKIDVGAFKNCSKLSSLTFLGKTAPSLGIVATLFPTPFQGVAGSGVLRYPAGVDYSTVKAALPDEWTVQELGPDAIESVAVSPSEVSVQRGASLRFSASVQGKDSPSQRVTWSVSPADGGSAINQDGLLTVADGETAESLTVTAVSVVNPDKSGSATVTVTDDSIVFTISGVITDNNTGTGLAGIPVTLWLEGENAREATTDAEGRYICENLPQGGYAVRAGGYASTGIYYTERSGSVTLLDGDKTCDLALSQGEPPQPSLGTFEAGSLRYDIISENPKEVSVRGWAGAPMERVTIPSTVQNGGETYDVVQIGDSAFYGRKLDMVSLPQNGRLRKIGAQAFYASNIRMSESDGTLMIPASVTHIGDQAFMLTYFDHLKFAENSRLAVIGDEAFHFTVLCDTLTIPASVTHIGSQAFSNTRIESLELPQNGSLSIIGDGAFMQPNSDDYGTLTGTVTIPASVNHIGDRAFASTSLNKVDLSAFSGTLGSEVFAVTTVKELVFTENPAPAYEAGSFAGMENKGIVYYPSGASGYTPSAFAGGALSGWTFTSKDITIKRPSMPLELSCYEGNGQVFLTWKAPENDGGAKIIKYQYCVGGVGSLLDMTKWRDVPAADDSTPSHRTTTYSVTGLENGTEYVFGVRAVNSLGAGEANSSIATPKESAATYSISGLLRSNNNMEPLPGLKVTLWQGGQQIGSVISSSDDKASFTFPPLSAGVYVVKAGGSWIDGVYYAEQSKAVTVTNKSEACDFILEPGTAPATAPGLPQNFTATPGDMYVMLTWEAPASDGGAEITKYQVSKDNGTSWTDIAGATNHTFTGLTNGQSYTFKVRAVNSVGAGNAASVTATPQAGATAPTVPQNFRAVPDDKQVALSWTAPVSDGGEAITKYEVSQDNGTSWENATSATGHTFTGLTNGQSYTFQVRAVNSVGAGAAASTTATPQAGATVPTVPLNFTATPGDMYVMLTWEAPASDGGADIINYEVSKDNGTSWEGTTKGTFFVFMALTNGQSYTFQVRAVNSVGAGEAASVTATPQAATTVPGLPQNFTATPGIGQVALSWAAPQSNGGAEITKYEVSQDGGTNWTDATSATGHTFTGLTTGQSYTFKVRAVNSVGAGEEASVTATPQASTFTLTVENGTDITASGPYDAGKAVAIKANEPEEGKVFLQWTSSGGGKFADAFSPETTFTMPYGNVTVTAEYMDDIPALTGEIKVATNSWRNFLNQLTLGKFFKETQEVTINSNGVGSFTVEYFATSDDLSEEEVKSKSDGWQLYYSPFSLEPNADLVVYARITDSRETIYLRSDRIVLDKTSPIFSLKDGATYRGAQTLTVSDNYALDSVKLGDQEQLPEDFTGKEKALLLNTNGTYTITAQDKAGNQASIRVAITDITAEQVTAPVFNPAGGTYDSPQSVEITCATEGVEIYYTMDGSAPTADSTKYAGVIEVSETTTIKAIAVKSGMADSEVTQAAYTIQITPAHTHSWSEKWTSDDSSHWHECTATDCTITENSKKDGYGAHTEGDWITTKQPTETETGSRKKECTICGFEMTVEEIPATGSEHTHELDLTAEKPATCVAEGHTKYYYCNGCGKYFSDSEGLIEIQLSDTVIPPTGIHTAAGDWQHDGENHWKRCSVCNQQAEKTVHSGGTANCHQKAVCTTCGAEYGSLNPENHHGETEVRGQKDATETEDGYTGDTYCLGCNKQIKKGEVIPKLKPVHTHSWSEQWTSDDSSHWHECTATDCTITENSKKDGYKAHTEGDWITTKQPTETEKGSRKKECTVCGFEMTVEEIPATGSEHTHELDLTAEKPATCVAEGHTKYYYCNGCGKYFSDSEGLIEIQLSDTVIPPTGIHTAAGDWQHDGENHWKRCSVCNQQAEKTVHSGGTANCHQKAVCETCGAEYGSLNPENHHGETEVRGQKDATETEDGYTGDTYCLGCNKQIKKGEVIPKKESEHTHEFAGDWQSDNTHHWQLCTAGDGEIGNKAAHSAGGWTDDKNLSENELSKRHRQCTVCAYRMATVVTIKTDGAAEIKLDKDGNWTFYGAFIDLKALRLNGIEMGIKRQSETSANLTYPGYEGIAGIAKAGSVEVTLYADFLKTLPAGTYTLEAEFASGKTTGTGSTEFIVSNDNKPEPKPEPTDPTNPADPAPKQDTTKPANPSDVPSTGDTRQLWPWMLLMLAAIISVSTIVIYKKKKGTNQQK